MRTACFLFFSGFLCSSISTHAAIHDVTASGANGGDLTDDTVAVQAAVTAASADRGVVYFPAGTYIISSTLNNLLHKHGFAIRGAGAASVVTLTSSAKDLFALEMSGTDDTLTINDIKFRATASGAQAALRVTYPDPGSTHNNTGVATDNVSIDVTGIGSWSYGIYLSNAWNSKIYNTTITNVNGAYSGSGVYIANRSVNSQIVSTTISDWSEGVNCATDGQEGLIIDGCTISKVNKGFYTNKINLLWISIQDSTFDCEQPGAYCILASGGTNSGLHDSFVRNNILKVAEDIPNTNPTQSRYHFVGRAEKVIFSGGNDFRGNNATGGIVFTQPDHPDLASLVSHNIFTSVVNGAALWLQTGVDNTTVVGNGFGGGWFFDQGTNTLAAGNY